MGDVGKVFMFGFEESVLSLERLKFFKSVGAKNFILFRRNIEHLKENIDILRNEFENPIIAVDCEGGNVRRFKETEEFMFSNMNIGSSFNAGYAEEVYFKCGQLLAKNGINLNLAPVVDIYATEGNVIGIRSFGSSEDLVGEFGKKAILGLHRAGVYACAKHFIGYGKVLEDPHLVLPKSDLDLNELEIALFPFRKVSDITDFIMTAHVIVPIIDELPITFSKKGIDLLKEFFNGVILTDDLEMGGAKVFPIHEIPVKALENGNDMLAVCSNFEIQKEMVHSIERSHINLDSHIEKIESLKEYEKLEDIPLREDYFVTLLKDNGFIPKDNFKFFSFSLFGEVKVEEGIDTIGDFSLDPDEGEIQKIVSQISKGDNVVISVYNVFRHQSQKVLVSKVKEVADKVCVIVAGDPVDRHIFDFVDCIILTFSPLPKIIEKALDVVRGKIEPKGRLPV